MTVNTPILTGNPISFTSSVAPTAADSNYPLQTLWTVVPSGDLYLLTNNTPGAAVWTQYIAVSYAPSFVNGIMFVSQDNFGDYKHQKSYTPTLTGSTTAGTTTYTLQQGYTTQIADRVFVDAVVQYTAATGTGNMQLSLPVAFPAVNKANHNYIGHATFVNITTPTLAEGLSAASNIPVSAVVVPGATVMTFFASNSGAAGSSVAMGAPSSGTGIITVSINYLTS